MVGLYSSLRPLTYRAPMGIQFRCNHDGWIPTYPRFIIIVTLGARFGPVSPQTLSEAYIPGTFTVMYVCTTPVIFLHAF